MGVDAEYLIYFAPSLKLERWASRLRLSASSFLGVPAYAFRFDGQSGLVDQLVQRFDAPRLLFEHRSWQRLDGGEVVSSLSCSREGERVHAALGKRVDGLWSATDRFPVPGAPWRPSIVIGKDGPFPVRPLPSFESHRLVVAYRPTGEMEYRVRQRVELGRLSDRVLKRSTADRADPGTGYSSAIAVPRARSSDTHP